MGIDQRNGSNTHKFAKTRPFFLEVLALQLECSKGNVFTMSMDFIDDWII